MMLMKKYHAVFSGETGFFNELDGIYEIEGYILTPCLRTKKDQHRACAKFALAFDFYGLDEKGVAASSERERRHWINMAKSIPIAKEFVAWLVLATGKWARLSSGSYGPASTFGPSIHEPIKDFDKSVMETIFHVDKNAKKGEFFEVKRPSFSLDGSPIEFRTLQLPSDFPRLTKKMFSLRKKEREEFLNACFSYQFALENWGSYPTVSILSLVSAVESMMTDEYTSSFCKDANRQCRLKKDVMKKFRAFFERNLQFPLPRELKSFLNSVYSKRSTYVHKALLGKGGVRGIQFGVHYEKVFQLRTEQRKLITLVNAALMGWLERI